MSLDDFSSRCRRGTPGQTDDLGAQSLSKWPPVHLGVAPVNRLNLTNPNCLPAWGVIHPRQSCKAIRAARPRAVASQCRSTRQQAQRVCQPSIQTKRDPTLGRGGPDLLPGAVPGLAASEAGIATAATAASPTVNRRRRPVLRSSTVTERLEDASRPVARHLAANDRRVKGAAAGVDRAARAARGGRAGECREDPARDHGPDDDAGPSHRLGLCLN